MEEGGRRRTEDGGRQEEEEVREVREVRGVRQEREAREVRNRLAAPRIWPRIGMSESLKTKTKMFPLRAGRGQASMGFTGFLKVLAGRGRF